MDIESKIYFAPGDLVTLRQDLPNKPIMLVLRKETSIIKLCDDEKTSFKGIRCLWFNNNQSKEEAVFNTKDLIKL